MKKSLLLPRYLHNEFRLVWGIPQKVTVAYLDKECTQEYAQFHSVQPKRKTIILNCWTWLAIWV